MIRGVPLEAVDRYYEFVSEFESETDRAAAVLAGAYLDALVEDELRRVLVSSKAVDELLEPSGALGAYGARISLAFVLGLISEVWLGDLRIIGRIRNRFAHRQQRMSFSEPPILDMCRSLKSTATARKFMQDDEDWMASPRNQFLSAVWFAMFHIKTATIQPATRRPDVPKIFHHEIE